jgi:hypothetical protein
MPTIAVLGANGQVGSEVCLILSQMHDVVVLPIVRTRLAAALLHRCGLECRVGSLDDSVETASLLSGADLVADFSLPQGQRSQGWSLASEHIMSVLRHAPPRVPYVYMSSTMAFGMNAGERRYANRLFSRTQYSSYKRRVERFVARQGRILRRPVYTFRLGQVHGELQQVTRLCMSFVTSGPVYAERRGEIPCDTLLCSTLAGGLVNLLGAADPPGLYTVVENPDWTWKKTLEFCGEQRGVRAQVFDSGDAAGPPVKVSSALRRISRVILGSLRKHKEFVMAHVPMTPQLEARVKIRYLRGKATDEIGAARKRLMTTPHFLHGPVPGRRLSKSAIADAQVNDAMARVGALLEQCLGPEGRNFSKRNAAATRAE